MEKLDRIELDLDTYKIQLQFHGKKEPLVIHFDTPSRRFYFALIALIVNEIKNKGKIGFIHIRNEKKTLQLLDKLLAAKHASNNVDAMWNKIRVAWRHRLPDLETAALFKIENRDLIPPYEKGGKYRYDCSDDECDTWANLFDYDESNKWRFKFAIDSASLDLDDIHLTFGNSKDEDAWKAFIDHLLKIQEPSPRRIEHKQTTILVSLYRPVLIAIIILIVSGLATWYFYNRSISDKPSIAILPFVNLSNDTSAEYFCDGVTDEVISKLARLKDLRVISRTSAFALKESALDIPTIGDKLGVDNILEGSVRVSGDKLKITTQLIKVADDSHLWAETYDLEKKDIFDLQNNLAQEIACNLKSRLGCEGGEIFGRHSTENLDAYNQYLKGRFFYYNNYNQEAIKYFKRAIEISPNYAAAYAGLADAFYLVALFNFELKNPYCQKAKSAMLKALELDDRLSEAYVSLAHFKMFFEWDWKGAEKNILRAIELNPGDAEPHSLYGHLLRVTGRLDEAIEEGKIALKLNPLSPDVNNRYGLSLMVDRQYEAAVSHLEATLKMHPEHLGTLLYLGASYLLQKRTEEGIALMEKAYHLSKDRFLLVHGILGQTHGTYGNPEIARNLLKEALEKRKASYFSPLAIALICQSLGQTDEFFEWLEKAYEERDPLMTCITGYHPLWKLHDDPRFQALLKKMGLEEWLN